MSRVKAKKSAPIFQVSRKDIYDGDIQCPICGQEVSAFRVASILDKKLKFQDYVGKCPICRKEVK